MGSALGKNSGGVAGPDRDRGETLVAVTKDDRVTVEEIRGAVKEAGLSSLCAPRRIQVVPEIPKLGTGKVNHRALAEAVTTG